MLEHEARRMLRLLPTQIVLGRRLLFRRLRRRCFNSPKLENPSSVDLSDEPVLVFGIWYLVLG